MTEDNQHEQLLKNVLDRVIQNNLQIRPGTPMAELKEAIEDAIKTLPPLDFEDASDAIGDKDAAQNLVQRAPEIIGWDADKIVEWVEELSKKI